MIYGSGAIVDKGYNTLGYLNVDDEFFCLCVETEKAHTMTTKVDLILTTGELVIGYVLFTKGNTTFVEMIE